MRNENMGALEYFILNLKSFYDSCYLYCFIIVTRAIRNNYNFYLTSKTDSLKIYVKGN